MESEEEGWCGWAPGLVVEMGKVKAASGGWWKEEVEDAGVLRKGGEVVVLAWWAGSFSVSVSAGQMLWLLLRGEDCECRGGWFCWSDIRGRFTLLAL